jgi:hypothetical protein
LVDLIKIKMAQTRSGNRGRGRGRRRISGGRGGGRASDVDRRTVPTTPAVDANRRTAPTTQAVDANTGTVTPQRSIDGGGRTSDASRRTAPTTQAVDANIGTVTPQRTTTIPRKNRGPTITLQQTEEPVAGPVITLQLTTGTLTTLQLTAQVLHPAITLLPNPNTQGSLHGSMPGLFPGTPNSRNTGQKPIVPIGTINQLLHEDNAKDLFRDILMELEITPYKELWNVLGIYNLETMNDFINRLSTMYNALILALCKVSPSFPEVTYYYIKVEEDIEKIVTDHKYF